MAEIKPVKVFTKSEPCTKVEIFNCFHGAKGFVKRPVVEAQGEIGRNAPKHMLANGNLKYVQDKNVDYLELTPDGKAWLTHGLKRQLELHPERAAEVVYPVVVKSARVLKRSR